MRIPAQTIPLLLLAAFLAPIAGAQEHQPLTASAALQSGIMWQPGAGSLAPGLATLKRGNQLRLTEATLSLDGDWDRLGFHVDGGYGDFYSLAVAGDSW